MADIFELFKKISPGASQPAGPVQFLVVGLGNPGEKYAATRHNAGFMALDLIARDKGVQIDRIRFKSLTARCEIAGRQVLLMKPATFMNLSGQAVMEALGFYKLTPREMAVISDDVNLDTGRLRIRKKGSDGGQNGLKNIIYLLGDDNFCRMRIGVGNKPHPDYDMADWVLSRFTPDEQKLIDAACEKCRNALPHILSGDIDKAMGLYNG